MGAQGEPDEIELSGDILANLSILFSHKKGDDDSSYRNCSQALI
jgi:hypothetical protein